MRYVTRSKTCFFAERGLCQCLNFVGDHPSVDILAPRRGVTGRDSSSERWGISEGPPQFLFEIASRLPWARIRPWSMIQLVRGRGLRLPQRHVQVDEKNPRREVRQGDGEEVGSRPRSRYLHPSPRPPGRYWPGPSHQLLPVVYCADEGERSSSRLPRGRKSGKPDSCPALLRVT